MSVKKDGQEILTGYREHKTRLWRVPLQNKEPEKADNDGNQRINAMIPDKTIGDTLQFLHQALFSPTKSTLLKAIKNGNLATWPMMTADNISKHLPQSEATSIGHMDQKRKNIRSTKPQEPDDSQTPNEDDGKRTQFVYTAIVDAQQPTGQIYTDQTGQLPVISSKGNRYVLVLYDYDSNAILAEPLKSRKQHEILRAYRTLTKFLVKRGLRPRLQKLDNEASQLLKDEMDKAEIQWQLVPPEIHRRNAAERAIRTYKNHLISGLASTDPKFPLHLWDRLIVQATLTLNLLRNSRLNPNLSAEAQLNGQFNYDATPLAPPGTKAIVHEKSGKRGTWAPHGVHGWYIGPARHHYRCWTVYIPKTSSERITDTLEFFPHAANMPTLSSADTAIRAAIELKTALQNQTPAAPFAPLQQKTLKALQTLSDILLEATQEKAPPSPRVKTPMQQPRG